MEWGALLRAPVRRPYAPASNSTEQNAQTTRQAPGRRVNRAALADKGKLVLTLAHGR